MLFPTWVWTSFSTMAGGGVHGKAAGIVHGTITPVGPAMAEPRIFIRMYRQAGGIITGIVVGTDGSGTISEYLSASFNGTGEPGKGTGIGSGIIPGVCKDRDIGRNREVTNRSVISHNTRWHHIVQTMIAETVKEGAEIEGTEGRMTIGLTLYDQAVIMKTAGWRQY